MFLDFCMITWLNLLAKKLTHTVASVFYFTSSDSPFTCRHSLVVLVSSYIFPSLRDTLFTEDKTGGVLAPTP
ncbi:hypothetical protein EB796_012877 [Bugula neritina]|uniref:Uncharacterized protein n=1 Tax=Bugula neritina TaxID=10212 RepID=A0A7J7JSE0_BUGNE|nr:hypothetical protein EB796_012877 [Bugula neritina]